MAEQNICHFIPFHKDYHSIHTINFVLEAKPQIYKGLKSDSLYKLYYVSKGSGYLHLPGKRTLITAGDLFFTFPTVPFAIESMDDFTYMYISFLGSRANMLLEKYQIHVKNYLFHGYEELESFWKEGLNVSSEFSDLMSESILLYTFAVLGSRISQCSIKESSKTNLVAAIKKYIDDNFSSVDFSMDTMSSELSYNKKYISSVFKRHMGTGISEYLNTIRIQNACTLAKQGFTSVNDIAFRCGFADPQYFSKVFKTKMGVSPRKYIRDASQEESA